MKSGSQVTVDILPAVEGRLDGADRSNVPEARENRPRAELEPAFAEYSSPRKSSTRVKAILEDTLGGGLTECDNLCERAFTTG